MATTDQQHLSISAEHVIFEKANRSMKTIKMAAILGIKSSILYNNRALIKRMENRQSNNAFFCIEIYAKNLVTI